jgi:hypothetical protein
MLTLDFIAKRMNGEIRGNQVACPGPGHSPKDRSLCIKVEPTAPAGFVVYSHAQDDNLKCKDFVLRQLGMEPFRPRHTNGAANSNPKIVAAYDYKDADGKLLYQVVRLNRRTSGTGNQTATADGYTKALSGGCRIAHRTF